MTRGENRKKLMLAVRRLFHLVGQREYGHATHMEVFSCDFTAERDEAGNYFSIYLHIIMSIIMVVGEMQNDWRKDEGKN